LQLCKQKRTLRILRLFRCINKRLPNPNKALSAFHESYKYKYLQTCTSSDATQNSASHQNWLAILFDGFVCPSGSTNYNM